MLEVLLALAVASICMTSLMCLIPVGLMASESSSGQTFANQIVSSIVSDLRSAPSPTNTCPAPTSQLYSISVPANGQSGSTTTLYFATDGSFVTTAPQNVGLYPYTVVVAFLNNGATSSSMTSTFATITVTWPGFNKYQTFVAMDRA